MSTITVEAEFEIPNGYRAVRIGLPRKGELYLNTHLGEVLAASVDVHHTPRIIVEKVLTAKEEGEEFGHKLRCMFPWKEGMIAVNPKGEVIFRCRDAIKHCGPPKCGDYGWNSSAANSRLDMFDFPEFEPQNEDAWKYTLTYVG